MAIGTVMVGSEDQNHITPINPAQRTSHAGGSGGCNPPVYTNRDALNYLRHPQGQCSACPSPPGIRTASCRCSQPQNGDRDWIEGVKIYLAHLISSAGVVQEGGVTPSCQHGIFDSPPLRFKNWRNPHHTKTFPGAAFHLPLPLRGPGLHPIVERTPKWR